jgi:hypothetical protein
MICFNCAKGLTPSKTADYLRAGRENVDALSKPFRIRVRAVNSGDPKRWIIHKGRYGSQAEAEAMAKGLGFIDWQVYIVVGPVEMVWVTRGGERIPLSQMEEAHLINTLNMLYRRFMHKVVFFYQNNPSPIGDRVFKNGPATMFPDKDNMAGWPALLAELRRRWPNHVPREWVNR